MKKSIALLLLILSFTSTFAQVTYIKEGRTNPAAGPIDAKVRELRQDTTNADQTKWGIYSIRSGTPDQHVGTHPKAVQALVDKESAIVKISRFGGGKNRTGAQNKAALIAAIAAADASGTSIIQFDRGSYTLDPTDIPADSITIRGMGSKTVIRMSTSPGDAVFKSRGRNGITIRDLTIDCAAGVSVGSGGIWLTGENNLVDNVEVRNADGFSIYVGGLYSNGVAWVPTRTRWNTVRNFIIRGQKRYHSIIAKAPLLVADSAAHTLVENGLIMDNFNAGETGDYIGMDHAVYTTFRNIRCVKTTPGLGDGAGMHLEGGEPYTNMYVTIDGLEVVNMTVGVSVSENVRASFVGQNRLIACKYPIKQYSAYPTSFSNFELIGCGAGVTSLTEALILNSTAGTYKNIKTIGSLANNSFINYQAVPASSISTPVNIIDCEFDKKVQASYTGVGSYYLNISGTTLTNTSLDWYDNVGLWVKVENCKFINSGITGARVGDALITNSDFIGSGSGTAINLTLDTYNTTVEGCRIRNYTNAHANAFWGFGNKTFNVTNAPVVREQAFVQGRPETRMTVVNTFNADYKAGFYMVVTPATGGPTNPFPVNSWYMTVEREDNGSSAEVGTVGNGYWQKQSISNLDGSRSFVRFRNGSNQAWGSWIRLIDASWSFSDIPGLASAVSGKLDVAGGTMTGNLIGTGNSGTVTATFDRMRVGTSASAQGNGGAGGYGFRADARTITDNSSAASTTTPVVVNHGFGQPTFAASNVSQTYSKAINVYIAGPPVAGTNVSFGLPYALYVNTGSTFLGTRSMVGVDSYNASALFSINGTTGGFLPPRMTSAQKNAITSPAEGLTVYDTDVHKLYTWDGTSWQAAW